MIRERATFLVCMAAWTMLAGCAARERPVTAVTIVADPGPFDSIEEAAAAEARVHWWDDDRRDDDACTLAFAAVELRRFLPECFGLAPASIRLASTLPDTGDAIVLEIQTADSSDSLEPGSFRTHSIERRGGRILTVSGHDRRGTLHGVYELLERLGTSFPGLGDTGIVRPRAVAPWPRRLKHSEGPAVPIRGFWAFEPRGHLDFFLWMARNRLNQWTAVDTSFVSTMKKLGFVLTGGGHTIQSDFLSPARHFATHPEWYGLHAGRRSPDLREESGDNFCTSNADARQAMAAAIVGALVDGRLRNVDLLEVWPLDMGRWCECARCRLQGSPTDRWLDVVAEVARAVRKARADGALPRSVEVSTVAYHETLPPPTRAPSAELQGIQVTFCPYFRCYAHELADSTCTEINRRLYLAWRGWARWATAEGAGSLGVCEYYGVGAFKSLPLIFPHVMARDLATYTRDTRLARFEYMHAPTSAWGAWTVNHHLISRLAWNPDQNVDSLLARLDASYYPDVAEAMRDYQRSLELASANILALQHAVGVYGTSAGGRLAQRDAPLFPLQHIQAFETHPSVNDGPDLDEIERAMAHADSTLERALARSRNPVERARIEEELRRFRYGQAMLAFDAGLIRAAAGERSGDTAGAKAAFAVAQHAAAALRGVTDLVQVSASHANARDGLEASGVASTYEALRRRYAR